MSSKSLFTSLALAVMLLCSAFSSSSGQTPCIPDCPGSLFGANQVAVIELPGGCFVRVTYATRLACGIWNDLAILSVEELTPGCSGYTVKQLLDLASKGMMENNPMGFPVPAPNHCVTSWRVVKGSCWKDSISCDGDSLIMPCGLTSCCLSSYRVCADSAGNLTAVKTGASVNIPCDPSEPECVPVCGDDEPTMGYIDDPELISAYLEVMGRGTTALPAHKNGGLNKTATAVASQKTLTRNE